MRKIASFQVNHDLLDRGIYVSRVDGDVITYDLRMKKPNDGDYLQMSAVHTIEHLLATYLRNDRRGSEIVYVGPMGCRTGFYVLTRDSIKKEDFLKLLCSAFEFIRGFEGEIPGTKKEECGNYADHDLAGAKAEAAAYFEVLKRKSVADLEYKQ